MWKTPEKIEHNIQKNTIQTLETSVSKNGDTINEQNWSQ